MKKEFLAIISFLAASQAVSSIAGVNVDINMGVPVAQPVAVQPVYVAPPDVVFEAQPNFIFSQTLGFYVSVGTPYDIAYIGNSYYYYSGGYWYVGPTYSGPWRVAKGPALPKLLVKYPYEKIRYYRDQEYRVYQRDPAHYHGRMHQPEWKRNEPHKVEQRKEEFRKK